MRRYRPGFLAELFRMEGRVALITGGHGELANAMACTLAELGCDVVLAARKQDKCEEIAARLRTEFGRRASGLRCDVSNEADVARTVAETMESYGRLDVLINNAGASRWGLPHEIPLKGWQKVMDVNLTGSFLCCREAARHMIAQGGGSIINISSVGAFLSYRPEFGQVVPYTTSKAAIVHLTRDLAAQWAAHGVRVNAIAPGSIETGMTETLEESYQKKLIDSIPLGRFGQPVELAGVVAILASGAGSFITGQTYIVDGGQAIG
ncbi:MAG: glucose 1-dehydrogenase [Steroidobacteraceae bacterium]|nr:glucose 1-dehydrogenase [Steroidobacteraceae bacterium]